MEKGETSVVFRYLTHGDCVREEGKATIPPLTELLSVLERVNHDLVAATNKQNPVSCATLDMDTTLIQTEKLCTISTCCYVAIRSLRGHRS